MTKKKVVKIPATRAIYSSMPIESVRKRRVAGYARVSTDSDEQFTSYEAQIDYYTNFIKSRADWEFVKVYTDEGITATNTKNREGFKSMVRDSLDGKIDLIVTKSVSRFARNTIDSLTTVRKLKNSGVEIYFEKENIWTFDSKGELLITIMSSLAQEESRSISENVTWGQRKRFQDGKVTIPYSKFLGYDKGKDGNLVVNEEEAKIIRKIYRYFLEGKSLRRIADELMDEGILSPGGKEKWHANTVRGILTNEKYRGDALLQKTFTVNFLTKEKKVNEGEVPQYYVEKNHEPIIDPLIWEIVQDELRENKRRRGCIFSNKIKCKDCGSYYGSKTWHSNSKYKRVVWQCNGKYKTKGKPCKTPHFTENEIKEKFIKATNMLIENKDHILEDMAFLKAEVFDTSELEKEMTQHKMEMEIISGMIEELITENSKISQDQSQYAEKYENLVKKFDKEKDLYNSIKDKIDDKKRREINAVYFIQKLEKMDDLITEFDPIIWNLMLDEVEIEISGLMTFKFRNGATIKV